MVARGSDRRSHDEIDRSTNGHDMQAACSICLVTPSRRRSFSIQNKSALRMTMVVWCCSCRVDHCMSSWQILSPAVKNDVLRTVREIESSTSAEVVVVVREESSPYLHVDMLFGCFFAFVWLCVFLFHPHPFDDDLVPFETLGAFVLGTVMSSQIAHLRRLLILNKWFNDIVTRAARAAFVEQGVFRTQSRTGLLVYVSLFERRALLVGDVGIEKAGLGDVLATAQTNIEMALRSKNAPTALTEAIRKLGEALATALPRTNNDVNELPDEVAA
jgi:putative membrane protein